MNTLKQQNKIFAPVAPFTPSTATTMTPKNSNVKTFTTKLSMIASPAASEIIQSKNNFIGMNKEEGIDSSSNKKL